MRSLSESQHESNDREIPEPLVITGPGGEYIRVYSPKPKTRRKPLAPVFRAGETPISYYARWSKHALDAVVNKILPKLR